MKAVISIIDGKVVATLYHDGAEWGGVMFGELGAVRMSDVRKSLLGMNYEIEEVDNGLS